MLSQNYHMEVRMIKPSLDIEKKNIQINVTMVEDGELARIKIELAILRYQILLNKGSRWGKDINKKSKRSNMILV